jgi:HD superfamily phosphohydrolase
MSDAAKSWFIADPIHQILDFGTESACIKSLIECAPVQRLRRISQLGLASYVFPCAVHTRFAHSLGTAHLAASVVDLLNGSIRKQDAHAVFCAAVLHDVGHGPFSHAFERAMNQILFGNSHSKRLAHGDWARKIITTPLAGPLEEVGADASQVADLCRWLRRSA